jgi:peptidoglycan/xylan/chitin deacetylase (PgdA/CDA1 family)
MTTFLVYHQVDSTGAPRSVSVPEFERHLRIIRHRGVEFVDPSRMRGLERATPGVVMCFDDGTVDHWTTVRPILERYGIMGLFYVPTQKIGLPGRVTEQAVRELHKAGHTIGDHGHTHDRWDRLSIDDVRRELATSRAIIGDLCGRAPDHAAPPGGFFTDAVRDVARASGFQYFRTMRWGCNRRHDSFAIEILPMTDAAGAWFIRAGLTGFMTPAIKAAYGAKTALRAVTH